MPRKPKKPPLTFYEKLQKIHHAGLNPSKAINRQDPHIENLETLEKRIETIFNFCSSNLSKPAGMIYFVMYDIENNKVRTQIAKYLIKKGCMRIQKSVFLASTDRTVFNEIHTTIKEVQEFYNNYDSVFFVPVSTDQLRSMKIVGQSINYEVVTGNKNTLFF